MFDQSKLQDILTEYVKAFHQPKHAQSKYFSI